MLRDEPVFPTSQLPRLCLAHLGAGARLRRTFAGLRSLARQAQSLELRLAALLAWLRRRDPLEVGYPSFAALCRDQVEWRRSWVHQVIRLVESRLELVKRAAREELIPLRLAVRAPAETDLAGEREWLIAAILGMLPAPTRRHLTSFEGEDAAVVRRARRLARLLIGRPASVREVDDFILAAWREGRPAEELLAAARTPPRAVEPSELPDLAWVAELPVGEAVPLVGIWSEPASAAEALARVKRLQAVLRGRRAVLARAWALLCQERAWLQVGYRSVEACAEEVLGLSVRTAQRLARIGRVLVDHPEVDRALRRDLAGGGLCFGAVEELGAVLTAQTAAGWVEIAARVGRRELAAAVEMAQGGSGAEVHARYRAAIDAADTWWRSGPSSATVAGPPRVALNNPGSMPPARTPLRAPPDLPHAGRWLLAHVQIRVGPGFASVKQRDGHRCQNPECGRLSLCNQAHHLQFRSRGGTDEPENGVTACRCCHLRGIHTGRIQVERVLVGGRAALLWRCGDRWTVQFLGEKEEGTTACPSGFGGEALLARGTPGTWEAA